MKILICNLGIGGGGAERVLVDLISYWRDCAGESSIEPKRDIDLFLIEKKKQDVYLGFCEENLRRVFSFPHIFGKWRFLNKFWKRRVLKNPSLINRFITEQYDVNIGFLEGISTIYISQKQGGKKIGYIHISLKEIRNNTRDERELEAYLKLDMLVCVSHYVKDSLLALYPELATKRIEVVYNPVNKDSILSRAQECTPHKERFTFLQVGRLTEQKGLKTLLEANALLQNEGLEYDIWLLGEGARYQGELEAMIQAQGVSNVRFLGFHANPYPYIKACDCMLLASYYEGYGLVLAEACVLGRAIIASDIPTSKEVLCDERGEASALLFPSKDAHALATQMREVYHNAPLRKKLESKALKRAESFSLSTAAMRLEQILKE